MRLTLPDPQRRWRSVEVDSPGVGGSCRYADGAWVREIDPRGDQRIEYAFVVQDGRRRRRVLDPVAEHRVETPFGPRSEWRAPGYAPPSWLSAPAAAGRTESLSLPSAMTHPLPVELWSPRGLRARDAAPLLWCLDGEAYASRSSLLQWAGAHIVAGDLPPFRIALQSPTHRMAWYSGSPRFLRSVDRALDELTSRRPTDRPVAVMGASLGGLTAMLVALRRRDVGAVLAQSGSFFRSGDEPSGRWTDRATACAERVRHDATSRRGTDLLVGMTCGRNEPNAPADAATAKALRRQGFRVDYREVADRHNEVAWRDALDPIWPKLLRARWGGGG